MMSVFLSFLSFLFFLLCLLELSRKFSRLPRHKTSGVLVSMSDIDSIIEKCIDDIWKTYDKDNSGFLDK